MTPTTSPLSPLREPDRLHVLDVLRGIALVGMFLVHFSMYSSGGTGVDKLYQRAVALLFEERFWAMFGMLFGVGFAIQLRRLAMFAWTGRMALTNYMIQIALLDLTFAKYALGLSVTPLVGLTMAIALFVADALFSRWWLARFRYGPFEWLWRSITYARWQPWRITASNPVKREAAVAIG
jgi:uncharacterized membrane protein YeiB